MINKLRNKYNSIPIQAKASVAFVICNILQKTISFITTPLYTRLLTTVQYGQFSLFQSWYSLIEVFATLNLFNAAFNNGMIKYKDDQAGFMSSMQGLSNIATIVVMVVMLGGWSIWKNVIQLPFFVVVLIFLQLLFYPAFIFWSAGQRYKFKYKALVAFTLLSAILVPVISCTAIMINSKQEYNGYIRIITSVMVYVVIGLGFYIYNFTYGKKFYVKNYWKFAFLFSVPLIPHYLSNILLGQIDRVMIANYASETEVAIYSLSIQISLLMNFVNSAMWSSLTPWMYQTIDEHKEKKIKGIATMLALLMSAFVLIPTIAAPEVIRILGTEEYLDGIWLIAPVSLTVLLRFVYGFFSTIEFYYGYSHYSTIASMVGAVVDVVLNGLLIPVYGYKFAGYTTLICYMIMTIMHYAFMKHVMKQKKIRSEFVDIKVLTGIIISCFVFSGIFMFLYSTILTRVIVGFLAEVVLGAILLEKLKEER